ncbi:MAG TPA: protein kinase, partial [Blastocatellia bacterium]|nr:protein kinase [Blastocatellia bacterium]
LPPQYTSDPGRIRRFEREARAASALNHPNIITIYEIGRIEYRHFIAAEFVDGQTLRELMSSREIKTKDVIEIAIQTTSALSAAHKAGIVHRDIKPENVMRRRDGYVKVLDFGLVKLIEPSETLGRTNASGGDLCETSPGAVLGTVKYMSPEQALGQEVDQRSDLFSFGVMLYEMLTGAPPFKGERSAAILDAIVHHHPLSVTTVREDLPAELNRILSRALEKDRELRYQTMSDLRADLKRLQRTLDSKEVDNVSHSERGAATKSGWKSGWTKRLTAFGALATLLVVAALASWRFGWRFISGEESAPMDWSDAIFTEVTNYTGLAAAPTLSPDGQVIVYASVINGQWDLFRQRVGGSNNRNLTAGEPANDEQPDFSPDGDWIAFRSGRNGGGIYVMGATGENVRLVANEGFNPSWSPDGEEIIYGTQLGSNVFHRPSIGSQIWAVNLKTGAKRQIPVGEDAVQPRWSPNGHRIAFWGLRGGAQRDIWTAPSGGGAPVAVTNDKAENGNPVWSPDGRYLYYSSNRNGSLSSWRVRIDERSGKTLGDPELIPTKSSNSIHMSIARNGRRIAYTNRMVRTNIKRVAFDAKRGQAQGESNWVTNLAKRATNHDISPDGQWLTFYIFGDPQFDIFVARVGGSEVRQLTDDEHKDRAPRWSPDGERIAFFSDLTGKYEIWTIKPDGSDRRRLTFSAPDQPGYLDPSWSPDGARILFSLRGGAGSFIMDVTRSWDDQTLFAFPPLPESNRCFVAYNWSHDGRKIAGTAWTKQDEVPGLVIYDLASRQYERITNEGNAPFWLRDNRRLLYAHNRKIYLADSRTKSTRELLASSGYSLMFDSPVLSRDERYLYYVVDTNEESIWVISLK